LIEALAETVGVAEACRALTAPRSWYYRQKAPPPEARPVAGAGSAPASALSEMEKAEVHTVLNSERFCDQSPREVYATLLDEGAYLCHWRTMYRILAAQGENRERRVQRRPARYARPELVARGPNEVWSWDITYLVGPKGSCFYYLYDILDIFSRYVVGWMIAVAESSQWAKEFIAATCAKQHIAPQQLTLHSDRGSVMKAHVVDDLLRRLGVSKSHGRPHTPNDNPFSETQFKTLKYHPTFPRTFANIEEARAWARGFFHWYNHEHHHLALGLLTPATVHYGAAEVVSAQRQHVLDEAYARHPERFSKGMPRVPQLPNEVWINRPPEEQEESTLLAIAPLEVEPGAQPRSWAESPAALDAGEHRATLTTARWLQQQDFCSLFVDSELSQSP
jgi:putative transposase